MEHNNLPQTTIQNDMMNITISEETIDQLERLADENALWGKIVEGGIIINDKVFAEIIGFIISIYLYY